MPAATGDKFGDPAGGRLPAAVERNPALVIMIVPIEDDRDLVLCEQGPDA